MASNRLRAIAISLAVALAPIGAGQVLAQTPPPAATAASLQVTIQNAAKAAAAQPGFGKLTAQKKLAAIQAAVSLALGSSGATSEQISAALIAAVQSGTISAGVAIQVAAGVSPELAQTVASSKVVSDQLIATGQTANVTTASTNGDNGAPSVLVSLQGAASTAPAGGDAGAGGTPAVTPAPYDPCAGVIATYCGS